MSDKMTPEAALRVSAEHLSKMHGASDTVLTLIAEADRLENAAKTPGEVLAEASGCYWADLDQYATDMYANRAAAVIAHHVGPGRVVVERSDVKSALTCLMYESPNEETRQARNRLREALS